MTLKNQMKLVLDLLKDAEENGLDLSTAKELIILQQETILDLSRKLDAMESSKKKLPELLFDKLAMIDRLLVIGNPESREMLLNNISFTKQESEVQNLLLLQKNTINDLIGFSHELILKLSQPQP